MTSKIHYSDAKNFTRLYGGEGLNIEEVLGAEIPGFRDYRDSWNRASRCELVTDYPIHLQFELNRSCNMRCTMCPVSLPSFKTVGKSGWFSFERFCHIIDEGVPRGLRSLGMNWINEPLIRSDLPDFIAYGRERGIVDVFLFTNGSLLDEEMAERLIDAGTTRLLVSLDAATQETYDKIRIGGDLAKIKANIERFVAIRTAKNKRFPLLAVNFVCMNENIHELESFMSDWRGIVDFFDIQKYHPINEDFENLPPASPLPGVSFNCPDPFRRAVITHDGWMMPCCSNYAKAMQLVNLDQMSVREFWHSPQIEELRRIHRDGEFWRNRLCRACASGASLPDSATSFEHIIPA